MYMIEMHDIVCVLLYAVCSCEHRAI